jgi:hypothetical protein
MATSEQTGSPRSPRRLRKSSQRASGTETPGAPGASRVAEETVARIERSMGSLGTAAIASMDKRLPWFRAMSAENRSWLGLVAQAGIAAFVDWVRHPERTRPAVAGEVFGTAPRELARAVSLQQAVEMVRVIIDVVEAQVDELAAPGGEAELREAVLRYTREVAFGAAQVYARTAEAISAAERFAGRFGAGPLVVGPVVPDLRSAAVSARAALAGLRAAAAWPDAPRPVSADELLPERVMDGDADARTRLVAQVYEPLLAGGSALVDTLTTYLEQGSSLEATARMLFVHPNTVRYRLRRVTELTGYAPSDGRDAFALWNAIVVGRLASTSD